jgi:ubiquinone/menaquinone biosynthesis C-methylase UbiE
LSSDSIKKAIRLGWDEMSESYQMETRISLDDVHYSPLCPGERELGIIGDVRGKRTLELACGAAQNSIALAKWGADTTAIDMSRQQLAKACELAAREGVALNLMQCDIECLAMLKDECFDLVISCFGMEFLPDPASSLSESYRLLRDNGLLVIGTVHPLTAFEWDADEEALCVTDYFNPPVEVWDEPTHDASQNGLTFFRTVSEMFALLTGAGFQVEQVVEPTPYDCVHPGSLQAPYGGTYWESQRQRLSSVPFAIVFKARKQPLR